MDKMSYCLNCQSLAKKSDSAHPYFETGFTVRSGVQYSVSHCKPVGQEAEKNVQQFKSS